MTGNKQGNETLEKVAKSVKQELADAYLDSIIEVCLEIKEIQDKLKQKRKQLASLVRDNRDMFQDIQSKRGDQKYEKRNR